MWDTRAASDGTRGAMTGSTIPMKLTGFRCDRAPSEMASELV